MIFLLGVSWMAYRFGRSPRQVTAAAWPSPAYDFFFVPPYFSFAVSDIRYIFTFAMMFGVSVVIGTLTRRLKLQQLAAVGRERTTAALYRSAATWALHSTPRKWEQSAHARPRRPSKPRPSSSCAAATSSTSSRRPLTMPLWIQRPWRSPAGCSTIACRRDEARTPSPGERTLLVPGADER